MQIQVYQGSPLAYAAPLVASGMWQDEPLADEIAALIEPGDFRGKAGQQMMLYPRDAFPCRRLLLLGLGERGAANADTLRQAAARAARKAQELQLERFAIALPQQSTLSPALLARAMVEGAALGLYRYLEHKTNLPPESLHDIQELTLLTNEDSDEIQSGVRLGAVLARGVRRARDLANMPGNILTPARMGEIAHEIGAQTGIQVTVLGPDELQQQGFGGLLAVGRGSGEPPRFIIMEHGTASVSAPTICLVGKGITFDTGGISIKPAASMDAMKMDMGGAAAVLGTMQVIGELQLPLRVVALISAAENMPDGRAFKPGDLLTTLSGKTVEVLNTDAEGRVVLADALFYAQRYQPEAIIDAATLTGAMAVALGPHAVGLMSNNQPLAERLLRAGTNSWERAWQLPLWDEYREMVKSEIADVRNTGGTRHAGAITAAAFLDAFVGEYAWAHLDIAGTAWTEGASPIYGTHGATGVGVRLLSQALIEWLEA